MSLTSPINSLSHLAKPATARDALNEHPTDASQAPAFGVRVAEIAALKPGGSIVIGQRRIPTLPKFDQAFSAFGQGTLFQADSGLVAVEDLQPGDRLMTADGTAEPLVWIGATTFSPSDQGQRICLTRAMADSFGVNRPECFVSFGPGARVLQTPPDQRSVAEGRQMMTPAHAFVDGVNVIEVMPPTPVRLFHLAMQRHTALIAGGLEVESYHPGPQPLHLLSHTMRSVFMSLFPHLQQVQDFGAMHFTRAPENTNQTAA